MKYRISCLFLVIFMTSCTVIQEDYYGPAPHVHSYYPESYHEEVHVHPNNYRPREHVMHDHAESYSHHHSYGSTVVVPTVPQVRHDSHEHEVVQSDRVPQNSHSVQQSNTHSISHR